MLKSGPLYLFIKAWWSANGWSEVVLKHLEPVRIPHHLPMDLCVAWEHIQSSHSWQVFSGFYLPPPTSPLYACRNSCSARDVWISSLVSPQGVCYLAHLHKLPIQQRNAGAYQGPKWLSRPSNIPVKFLTSSPVCFLSQLGPNLRL